MKTPPLRFRPASAGPAAPITGPASSAPEVTRPAPAPRAFALNPLAGAIRAVGSLPRGLVVPAAASLMGLVVGFQPAPAAAVPASAVPRVTTMAARLPTQLGVPAGSLVLDVREFQRLDPVGAAVARARNRLLGLATTRPETFEGVLRQVYGGRVSPEAVADLLAQARAGQFPAPAQLRVVDPGVLAGADAAYSPRAGGTLFVSRALLGDLARLDEVVLEEIGHHVDSLLGPGDAVGDEGQLFRTAVEQGRLLRQAELRSGQLDRDQRTIQVDGELLRVEYSVRAEERAYEAAGVFSDADVRRGADARLAAQVEAEVIARAAVEDPTIATLAAASARFEAAGRGLEDVKAEVEAALVCGDREGYLASLGAEVVRDAVTSSVAVRLKEGQLLAEDATLATPLPSRAQARVDADPTLGGLDPRPTTWGALLLAIAGDVDADGRLDIDALTLARFLPDASAQGILRALQTPLTATQMREKLAAVGFSSPIVEGMSVTSALDLTPPKLFGLAGRTSVDRAQQQLLLRTGKIFVDSNEDGKIDDGDAVHFVDADGTIKETTYQALPEELKKAVRLNLATAQVAEDYAALPASQRMRFPHYHADRGESDPEAVNGAFWSVSVAEANDGQVSWELKAGQRPSDALADVFGGNGGQYTTECAHGRNVIRLQGLRRYYEAELGGAAGVYRFDMLFAATAADKARCEAYLAAYERSGKSWDEFTKANPMPEVTYALEVSRHQIFGKDEAVLEVYRSQPGESAGGDTGYFHNYSVSVQGVKIGYVGENVIDLGYRDGVRRYWGHPGGVQTEKAWQQELASSRITVTQMSDFAQYFSNTDTRRGAKQVTEVRVRELEKQVRELRLAQAPGYEARIAELEGSMGWWRALEAVRVGLVDHLDRGKLDEAATLFSGQVPLRDADGAKPIYELLTADGRAVIAKAFAELDAETRRQAVQHFGVADEAALSDQQRAQTALFSTLTQYGAMHGYLKGEALGIVETERFTQKQDWLTGQGHLATKANLQAWLKTDDFARWYRAEAGTPWAHGDDLARLTTAQVRGLVELAFPMVKGKRTIYAEVNRGTELMANQMATLLHEGALPGAEYRLDSQAVAPLH